MAKSSAIFPVSPPLSPPTLSMSSPISLQIPKFPLSCHTETLPRVSHLPPNPSILHPRASHYSNLRKTLVGAGHNQPAAAAAAANSQISETSSLQTSTASDVIKAFYDGINRRELGAVERLIGEDCVYEDLVFSQPFVGRKAILEFFKNFTESISKDLQFVIDDISNEDLLAVGVTWHLEWKGRPFPFSKGCSFYRLEVLDGRKQITNCRVQVVQPQSGVRFKPIRSPIRVSFEALDA